MITGGAQNGISLYFSLVPEAIDSGLIIGL
jgi:hypothetical protein